MQVTPVRIYNQFTKPPIFPARTYPRPPRVPYPHPRRFSREGHGARDRLACVGRWDCGAGVNPRGTADSLQEIGRLRGGSNDPVPWGQVPTHPLAAMRGSKVSRAQTARLQSVSACIRDAYGALFMAAGGRGAGARSSLRGGLEAGISPRVGSREAERNTNGPA
jgi:hypothetical protein